MPRCERQLSSGSHNASNNNLSSNSSCHNHNNNNSSSLDLDLSSLSLRSTSRTNQSSSLDLEDSSPRVKGSVNLVLRLPSNTSSSSDSSSTPPLITPLKTKRPNPPPDFGKDLRPQDRGGGGLRKVLKSPRLKSPHLADFGGGGGGGGLGVKTHSLDVPGPSAAVLEARRQSVTNRSKSLNASNSEDRPDNSSNPGLAGSRTSKSSSRDSIDNLGAVRPPLPNTDCPKTRPEGSSAGGNRGVLASFKAKYSSTVVGYGAENCSWSFLLSLPHLIMVSNLQSFFGAKGGKGKLPSIQPNEYMDGVIANMKADMKER